MNLRVKGGIKALWGSAQIGHGIGEFVQHMDTYGTWWYYAWCAYLIIGFAAYIYGMTGLAELVAGKSIGQLNQMWIDLDRRPVIKGTLSVIAFFVFMLYVMSAVFWCALYQYLGIVRWP